MRDFFNNIYQWLDGHPFWFNLLLTICASLAGLFSETWYFILGVPILVYFDTHFGIIASQKKGIEYSSKMRRKGLLDKTKLFLQIVIMTLVVDLMLSGLTKQFHFDIQSHYLTIVILFFIGIYEATSIIEKLKIIHPNNKVIGLLGKIFMIMEKDLTKRVLDKIGLKEDEIKEN